MTNKLEAANPKVTTNTNILEIEVPKQMEKSISTGMPHFDKLCAGDGVVPSTVLLLTGLPGLGKTTLGLQLADAITGSGNIALYNTCEESLFQVRKTVKRLRLENGFIPSYKDDVDALIEYAEQVMAENPDKQLFLFVDSLQTLELNQEGKKGRHVTGQTQAVQVAWKLANWAKKTYAIVVLVGQVTKDGVFAGKQEIKHAIDCHLHLCTDTERYSSTYGARRAIMEKNRFGIAGLYYGFEINAGGLNFKAV